MNLCKVACQHGYRSYNIWTHKDHPIYWKLIARNIAERLQCWEAVAASGRAATARRGGYIAEAWPGSGGRERRKDSLAGNPEKRFYSRRALSDLSSGHGGTESLCGELLWIGQPGCSVRSGGIGHLEIESKEYQFSSGIGSQQAAQVGAGFNFMHYCL